MTDERASRAPAAGWAKESSPFVRIAHRQLWSAAVDHLRELIDSGRIAPGTRLPSERELCRQLGISRVSLREALRVLESMGYVEVRRGHGTFIRAVPSPAASGLEDWLQAHDDLVTKLFELRLLVEPGVGALVAARADAAVLERLDATIEEMQEAAQADDLPRVIAADAEFHHILGHGTQNTVIGDLMEQAMHATGEERRASLAIPGQTARAIVGHRAILQAIAEGDAEGARRAMEQHLRDAQTYIERWRKVHPVQEGSQRERRGQDERG